MPLQVCSIFSRPRSQLEVSALAERLLRKSGAVGVLPTPIEDLIASAGIKDVQDSESFMEQHLASLPEKAQAAFKSAMQKIRGIADLREEAIYVPTATTVPRVRFAKAHELGHQILPWQKLNPAYQDDNRSLSSEAEDLFDIEANHFAAEIIFQGYRFAKRVRDYRPSFDAIFLLADEHCVSKHATLRRYVEEHDEPLAAITYWPSIYATDEKGFPVLRLGKIAASPRFSQKYSGVPLPFEIQTGHEWAEARDRSEVCKGNIGLDCGSGPVKFQWQSWWNNYSLLILLRLKPSLSIVSHLLR